MQRKNDSAKTSVFCTSVSVKFLFIFKFTYISPFHHRYRLKDIREIEKTQGVAPPLLSTETINPDDKRVRETLQWMIQDEVSDSRTFFLVHFLTYRTNRSPESTQIHHSPRHPINQYSYLCVIIQQPILLLFPIII